MEKVIAPKVKSKEKIVSFSYDQLTIQQLIDLTIDLQENGQESKEPKQELINRGKDNIQTRILIKKACKTTINTLETPLKQNNINKEVLKASKQKFLTSLSLLDRLQLEWQKYDLGLKF